MSVTKEESNGRLTSLLGNVPTERLQSIYDRHGVKHSEGIEALVDELRLDGSNTIASLFRGLEGVPYLEIVQDVASKMGVEYTETQKEDTIEYGVLGKVLEQFLENATPEDRQEIDRILSDVSEEYRDQIWQGLSTGALAVIVNTVGKKIVAEVVRKIVFWIAMRQGAKGVGKRAATIVGLAIPLLNVALVAWTVIDLAGPAYRKTVPTVIEIALLRLEFGGGGRK